MARRLPSADQYRALCWLAQPSPEWRPADSTFVSLWHRRFVNHRWEIAPSGREAMARYEQSPADAPPTRPAFARVVQPLADVVYPPGVTELDGDGIEVCAEPDCAQCEAINLERPGRDWYRPPVRRGPGQHSPGLSVDGRQAYASRTVEPVPHRTSGVPSPC